MKLYRNDTLRLNLTAFSLLCLLILVGGLAYHGSLAPETKGATSGEAALMWSLTVLLIGLPVITVIIWVRRLASGRRDHR